MFRTVFEYSHLDTFYSAIPRSYCPLTVFTQSSPLSDALRAIGWPYRAATGNSGAERHTAIALEIEGSRDEPDLILSGYLFDSGLDPLMREVEKNAARGSGMVREEKRRLVAIDDRQDPSDLSPPNNKPAGKGRYRVFVDLRNMTVCIGTLLLCMPR